MTAEGLTHLLTLNPSDFKRYKELTVMQPADLLRDVYGES